VTFCPVLPIWRAFGRIWLRRGVALRLRRCGRRHILQLAGNAVAIYPAGMDGQSVIATLQAHQAELQSPPRN
jgi:hypothetical protein